MSLLIENVLQTGEGRTSSPLTSLDPHVPPRRAGQGCACLITAPLLVSFPCKVCVHTTDPSNSVFLCRCPVALEFLQSGCQSVLTSPCPPRSLSRAGTFPSLREFYRGSFSQFYSLSHDHMVCCTCSSLFKVGEFCLFITLKKNLYINFPSVIQIN